MFRELSPFPDVFTLINREGVEGEEGSGAHFGMVTRKDKRVLVIKELAKGRTKHIIRTNHDIERVISKNGHLLLLLADGFLKVYSTDDNFD